MARLAAGGNALDTISWLGTFLPSCLACLTFSCTKSRCLPLSLSLSVGVKFELLIAVQGILSLISLFLASFAKYYVYAYAALAAAACKFCNLLALFLHRKWSWSSSRSRCIITKRRRCNWRRRRYDTVVEFGFQFNLANVCCFISGPQTQPPARAGRRRRPLAGAGRGC